MNPLTVCGFDIELIAKMQKTIEEHGTDISLHDLEVEFNKRISADERLGDHDFLLLLDVIKRIEPMGDI